jgi:hypothetical protein
MSNGFELSTSELNFAMIVSTIAVIIIVISV